MKKITTILLFFFPIICFAQNNPVNGIIAESQQTFYVNKIPIDSIPIPYADVVINRNLSGSFNAYFRYGQNKNLFRNGMNDAEGRMLFFDGLAEILNLLHYHGWELVQEIEGLKIDNQICILVSRLKNK